MSKYNDDDLDISDAESGDDDEVLKPSKKIPQKIEKIIKLGEDEDDVEDSDDDSLKSSDGDDSVEADEEDMDEEERDKRIETKSALPLFPEFEDSDEEEDEDEEDENYLQKFDESTKHNIISDFHPEMQAHNYDEVDILATIVRNNNGLIIDPLHRTVPFITKYERARILGERAKQLNSGARAFVEVEPTVIDGYLIALKEYEQKKIPFILKRPLPNGGCEYWRMRDLEI
jgi:DNA-directed RNA polymerase I, II, and III subunit RPABC2